MKGFLRIALSMACAAMLSACIQTGPIPGYARVGDEVVVGLGGIHHNAMSNYQLAMSDIHAQLTDSAGHVFNLQTTSVFKAFPDYVSKMNYNTVFNASSPGAVPTFDGGWFASLKIKDANNTGVPIALGNANIVVSSPKLQQSGMTGEGNYAQQKIEIIAGTSSQGTFSQQFAQYAGATTYVRIAPDNLAALAAVPVAGFFIQIDYTDGAVVDPKAMILPFAHHPFIQVSQARTDRGDGTGSITAFVMNPSGFVATTNRQSKQSSLEDLTVALMAMTGNGTPANLKAVISVNAANSYFIDTNGNVIANVKPQVL